MAAEKKQKRRNKHKIINPHAMVIIYNYTDRLGTDSIEEPQSEKIDQIILNTSSLLSINTSKSKSQPQGTFEFVLAPWKNWTTAITPGSWCVILAGQTPIKSNGTKYDNLKVDKKQFKMLGRIESVRSVTTVDQTTGALMTSYIVSGVDWGSIFNTFLYIDEIVRESLEKAKLSPIGVIDALANKASNTAGKTDKQDLLYSSTNAIKYLIAMWGATSDTSNTFEELLEGRLTTKVENAFSFPIELANYMGFKNKKGEIATKIADLISFRGDVLTGYDTYSATDTSVDETRTDGIGFINPQSLFGINSVWQIMTENCNKPLNELVTDIRWEGDTPLLCLYKRVKPFKINTFEEICEDNLDVQDSKGVAVNDFLRSICSDYKNVRRHKIASEDIISISAGTNWRDRFNFVEVRLGRSVIPAFQNKDLFAAQIKLDSQFRDRLSIKRDGFIPMTMTVNYLPPNSKKDSEQDYNLNNIFAYKYLGKEWYFDTHKMLNGVITIIGQDNYIQVGDNIMFQTKNISSNYNINTASSAYKESAYITAHVENISHRVTVSENGVRSFITEIQFVRGIVTNSNGEKLDSTAEQTLNQDVSKQSEKEERNSDRVIGTSSGSSGRQDPDRQKMGKSKV